jgi:hypothetical protein
MGPKSCSETSVRNRQSTLRKIPKQRGSHLHCGGSLKSRINGTATFFNNTSERFWKSMRVCVESESGRRVADTVSWTRAITRIR